MSKKLNKISFVAILILLPLFQGCTETSGFYSSRPSSNKNNTINDILNPVKDVRGPTGGGIGGGIRIADSNGNVLKNKKVEIYISSFGTKEKIKDAYTDSNGEITLDSKTLERINEIGSDLIVEFYDGKDKSVADAKIINNSNS